MTTDDDMREIEAALDEFQDASERVYEANPDPAFGDPLQRQKGAREALLALIRQKLPQNDAEHERAVAAWEAEATRISIHCGVAMQLVQRLRDEGARLMRARPAIEPHTFTGLPDTTYEKLVAKEKAAGDLLRAAKHAVACGDFEAQPILDLSQAVAKFEAAERAGVR